MRGCAALALAVGLLTGYAQLSLAQSSAGQSRSARSGAASPGLDTPEKLARAYIAAVRSHSAARVLALYDPRVLACRTRENEAYFHQLVADEFRYIPRSGYLITITSLHGPASTGLAPEIFTFPVRPMKQLRIDTDTTNPDAATIVRAMAADHGRWYLVYPCPTAAGMKALH